MVENRKDTIVLTEEAREYRNKVRREYYEANRDRINARRRERYAANREKQIEYNTRYLNKKAEELKKAEQ